MYRTRFAIALSLLVAGVIALSSAAWGEDAAQAKWNPSEAGLKAKNRPGQNWEGPHVPELMTLDDLEKVWKKSEEEPVLIFKHSTTCGVAAEAAYRMNEWLKTAPESAPDMVFLKVRERRPVSNAVEAKTKVKHESPQILLIEDRESLWDTSHHDITAENLNAALEKYLGTEKDEEQ